MKFTSFLSCIALIVAASAAPATKDGFLPSTCPTVQGPAFAATSLAVDYLSLTGRHVLAAIESPAANSLIRAEISTARTSLSKFKGALQEAQKLNEEDPVRFRSEFISGMWHTIQWEWATMRAILNQEDEDEVTAKKGSLNACLSNKSGCAAHVSRFNIILDKLNGFKQNLIETDACVEWTKPENNVERSQ